MPPIAAKIPHILTVHGDTRVDEYYWMRDKDDPELIKYLEAENAYTAAMTADLKESQDQLYKEFVGRIKQTDETAPVKDGEYWYSKRTVEGLNYPIYIRRKGSPSGPEQVYLDVNVLAKGKEYMSVTCMDVSHDGKYLAYLVDETGYESCTLKFRNLDTGKDLPYQIHDVGPFSLAWGYSDPNKPMIFYTRVDETKRRNRIMRAQLRLEDIEKWDELAQMTNEELMEWWVKQGEDQIKRYNALTPEQQLSEDVMVFMRRAHNYNKPTYLTIPNCDTETFWTALKADFPLAEEVTLEDGSCCWRIPNDGTISNSKKKLFYNDTNEVEVFQEDDVKFNVEVNCSLSGEFIIISSTSATTSEVWTVGTRNPESPASLLRKREQGVTYKVSHQKGEKPGLGMWWFITDHDGAMNYKVMRSTEGKPDQWVEIIPESGDVLIEDITCFESLQQFSLVSEFESTNEVHIVLSERRGGFTAIRIITLHYGRNSHLLPSLHDSGYTQRILTTPESICEIGLAHNSEYVTPTLRIRYESPITPPSTYDVSFATGQWTLVKQLEVLGYSASLYEVSLHYATANDSTQIPMSIVYRKGIVLDRTNLGYLYGYGSYGSCIEPDFRSNLISLLDRGVVCAIAHVRGGSEMGRAWKEGGKMMNKMNTFTDFISCAEELIRLKYTSADRLAIEGGSAGGLLIGAVVNMRPDLFKVAHAAVPFVDVLTTMLDETIPLTTEEWEEWGNPNEKEAYEYMKSYSPYDNVKAQDYPNMLITSGINDPRVAYWEPTKWIARLRDRSTGDGVKLLKMNMGSGHGGSSGRYDRLKEVAFQWAYLLHHIMKK